MEACDRIVSTRPGSETACGVAGPGFFCWCAFAAAFVMSSLALVVCSLLLVTAVFIGAVDWWLVGVPVVLLSGACLVLGLCGSRNRILCGRYGGPAD